MEAPRLLLSLQCVPSSCLCDSFPVVCVPGDHGYRDCSGFETFRIRVRLKFELVLIKAFQYSQQLTQRSHVDQPKVPDQ